MEKNSTVCKECGINKDLVIQIAGSDGRVYSRKIINRLLQIKEVEHSLAKNGKIVYKIAYKHSAILTNNEKLVLIEKAVKKHLKKVIYHDPKNKKEEMKMLNHDLDVYGGLVTEIEEILGVIEVLPPTLFRTDFKQKQSKGK